MNLVLFITKKRKISIISSKSASFVETSRVIAPNCPTLTCFNMEFIEWLEATVNNRNAYNKSLHMLRRYGYTVEYLES